MGTAVLPAQDSLASYQRSHDQHVFGMVYPHAQAYQYQYGMKSESKRKSGVASRHAFCSSNHGGGGYVSSNKAKVKGGCAPNENGSLSSFSPERKRFLKSKAHGDFRPEFGKRANGSECKISNNNIEGNSVPSRKPGKILVVGQVTLLKRGQNFENAEDVQGFPRVRSNSSSNANKMAEKVNRMMGDFLTTQREPLGPDPAFISNQSQGMLRSVSAGFEVSEEMGFESGIKRTTSASSHLKVPNFPVLNSEKWAGPAFSNSPSPRCLPLPSFFVKKSGEELIHVDKHATRDLRRLLGLD